MRDADAVREMLATLVRELAAGGYRDRLGHPVTNNLDYRAAVALLARLELRDVLEAGNENAPGGSRGR